MVRLGGRLDRIAAGEAPIDAEGFSSLAAQLAQNFRLGKAAPKGL